MKQREKRGGGVAAISLDEGSWADFLASSAGANADLVRLDDALNALAELDAKQSQIVEMRFFAGMSVEEVAEALDISPATVKRHWATARAFLAREMQRSA
jgi:RNA polymerase sigma factor (sigma-70 family)